MGAGPMAGRRGRQGVRRRAGRLTGAAAVAATVAGALAGCSGVQAGSAAVVGTSSISESTLQGRVQSFVDSLPRAQQAGARADLAKVQGSILNQLVVESAVDRIAATAGVTVTPSQVSSAVASTVAGEGTNLATDLAQFELTRQTLPDLIRVSLLYVLLGRHVGGAALTQDAAQVRGQAFVAARAKELPVTLSPRYGTWDSSNLSLSGAPESISTPAPTASAGA